MSDLIRRRRSVTTSPSSEPPAQSASAATTPALMVELPGVSQAPTSSASSVAQPVSARRRHRPASTTDTTSTDAKKNTRGPCRQLKTAKVTRVTNSRISIGYDERHRAAPTAELHSSLAHDVGHVVRTHCLMRWKSWKVMPDEIKMQVRGQLSTNYNLEDLNEESLAYVNRLFGERYKQWKSDLDHHFQAYDDPERSTSLVTFMFDMGMSWPNPPQDAGFQILTETLDQTLGRRPGTYCRGMGNARQREPRPRSASQANSQVTVLTSRVAELEGQMSVILQSLSRSGIPIPNFGTSTSETSHPEHPQQTTAPVDPQIPEPHMPDDHVDFGTLFD
ncbi:unnamed protein product [Prunus brigantina]